MTITISVQDIIFFIKVFFLVEEKIFFENLNLCIIYFFLYLAGNPPKKPNNDKLILWTNNALRRTNNNGNEVTWVTSSPEWSRTQILYCRRLSRYICSKVSFFFENQILTGNRHWTTQTTLTCMKRSLSANRKQNIMRKIGLIEEHFNSSFVHILTNHYHVLRLLSTPPNIFVTQFCVIFQFFIMLAPNQGLLECLQKKPHR